LARRARQVAGWSLILSQSILLLGSLSSRAVGCSNPQQSARTQGNAPGQPKQAAAPVAAERKPGERSSPPDLLGARAPDRLIAAWQGWWRKRGRPRTVRHGFLLHGRRVVIIREALPPGWHYPCTDEALEATLRELPAAWTARLRSVRWTYRPEWGAHARTDRSRIEISYVVDELLRSPGMVSGHGPEEVQFGARLVESEEGRSLVWVDRASLGTYILRHILIHELGHHVAPPGMRVDDEEAWAEAFAFRFFTPTDGTKLAESRP
jgi:hypothetical protein